MKSKLKKVLFGVFILTLSNMAFEKEQQVKAYGGTCYFSQRFGCDVFGLTRCLVCDSEVPN